jgi:hypothetical protein
VVAAHTHDTSADAEHSLDSGQWNRVVEIEVLDVQCEEARRAGVDRRKESWYRLSAIKGLQQ